MTEDLARMIDTFLRVFSLEMVRVVMWGAMLAVIATYGVVLSAVLKRWARNR